MPPSPASPSDSSDPVFLSTRTFSLTRDDVAAMIGLRQGRAIAFDLKWFLAAAALTGAGMAAAEDFFDPASLTPKGVGLAVGAAAMGLGFGYRAWRRARAASRWPLPARTQVAMTGEGLTLNEDGRARRLAWSEIGVVQGDDERLTLLGLAPQAWAVLPARAFADAQAMRAFHWLVEERLREDDGETSAPETTVAPPEGRLSVETRIAAEDARRALSTKGGKRISYAAAFSVSALIGAGLIGGLAFLVAPAFAATAGGGAIWLWGALAGAALGALALGLKFDRAEKRVWESWRTQAARLDIDADGLTRSADGVVARFAWRRIDDVETTPHDLIFRMDREIVPAPRHCFASPEAFDAFAAAARAWRRAALASSAAAPP